MSTAVQPTATTTTRREPRATAVTLRASDQHVFHDPAHQSAVVLPLRKVN